MRRLPDTSLPEPENRCGGLAQRLGRRLMSRVIPRPRVVPEDRNELGGRVETGERVLLGRALLGRALVGGRTVRMWRRVGATVVRLRVGVVRAGVRALPRPDEGLALDGLARLGLVLFGAPADDGRFAPPPADRLAPPPDFAPPDEPRPDAGGLAPPADLAGVRPAFIATTV